jgi:hypothetical protein
MYSSIRCALLVRSMVSAIRNSLSQVHAVWQYRGAISINYTRGNFICLWTLPIYEYRGYLRVRSSKTLIRVKRRNQHYLELTNTRNAPLPLLLMLYFAMLVVPSFSILKRSMDHLQCCALRSIQNHFSSATRCVVSVTIYRRIVNSSCL